jgi:flagellar hook-basal body complex protein FliE
MFQKPMLKIDGFVMNAADLQKQVEQFKRDAETPVQGPDGPEPEFGQQLREATERRRSRTAATSRTFISADESFGEKLKRAVEKLPSKQEKEREKKQAKRYKPFKPRPHTKSE